MLEYHPPHEAVAANLTQEQIKVDLSDGMVDVPNGPGLGLTIKSDVLEEYRVGEPWILK